MPKSIDITSRRFGRLVAIREISHPRWLFRCDCGIEKIMFKGNVIQGHTVSCGCFRLEAAPTRNVAHGHTIGKRSKIYRTWSSMFTRCYNPHSENFPIYGGRGIIVCDRWHVFENFLTDMKEPLPGLSLERIDTNRNYEPDNCRWATSAEQGQNRRNNKLTAESAALIRQDTRRYWEIASTYGVSISMVGLIKQGKTWK